MSGSKSSKTNTLLELTGEYYRLDIGVLIEKPTELLRVTEVKDSKHEKHPHKEHRVYISRKALKHVVEERRTQLTKHHTPVEVLQKISFAIEQMPEVIVNFDKYEYEVSPEKHFYTKHYKGEPSIRILCEIKTDEAKDVVLEICSVHFRKQQKDK